MKTTAKQRRLAALRIAEILSRVARLMVYARGEAARVELVSAIDDCEAIILQALRAQGKVEQA